MKNTRSHILFFLLLLFNINLIAINKNESNYILKRDFISENSYIESVEYFDGLGRPYQQMVKNFTPSGLNLITFQEYDRFGRKNKDWLPVFTSDELITNIESLSESFYINENSYDETVYEMSPLNREIKNIGAGNAWADHPIKKEYRTNVKDSKLLGCIYFEITQDNKLKKNNQYNTGELYIEKIINEDNQIVYIFTDKLGRLLLERKIYNSENIDTYYVYDDYGNLIYVLPPQINFTSTTISTTHLNYFAYKYEYDQRNRCVKKTLPGGAYIQYIYDNSDRIRLQQDSNQKNKNQWLYYKYDIWGRIVIQGTIISNSTIARLKEDVTKSITYEQFVNNNSYCCYTNNSFPQNNEQYQIINYYDNYDYLKSRSIYFTMFGLGFSEDISDEKITTQKT